MSKEVYIFSGLGADERVFHRLDFSDFSVTYIKWIVPEDEETMTEYAFRLLEQIRATKPILIGLSFGGIVAIEVAKLIETEKVIIIASAKTKNEIPFYYRFAGQLGLHKLVPTVFFKRATYIANWFFGASSMFEKQLLKQILTDVDPAFLKWALNNAVRWKSESQAKNLVHIHGSSDRILPMKFVQCDITIPGGGHFMVLNRAEEINHILWQQLR